MQIHAPAPLRFDADDVGLSIYLNLLLEEEQDLLALPLSERKQRLVVLKQKAADEVKARYEQEKVVLLKDFDRVLVEVNAATEAAHSAFEQLSGALEKTASIIGSLDDAATKKCIAALDAKGLQVALRLRLDRLPVGLFYTANK